MRLSYFSLPMDVFTTALAAVGVVTVDASISAGIGAV